MNKKSLLLALAGVALIGSGLVAPSANADPADTPRLVNGMGSDTTFRVMNAMSDLQAGSEIASWDPTPANAPVDLGSQNCSAVPRANGSSAGRTALINDTNNCLQFARSSSFSSNANLSYYPFAEDGFTYAITSTSDIANNLTKAQVQAIYRCETEFVAVLPQTGSGSRGDWLTHVFGSSTFPPAGVTDTSCYLGGGTDNAVLPQEHDGRALKDNQIMPYSVANWIAQMNGQITDVRGRTILPRYDTGSGLTSPVMLNPNGAYTRTVYNAIRRADAVAIDAAGELTTTQQAIKDAFVGSGSVLCSNDQVLVNYGFAPVKAGATYACGARRD